MSVIWKITNTVTGLYLWFKGRAEYRSLEHTEVLVLCIAETTEC